MSAVFSWEVSTSWGTVTYLYRTNFFDATWSNWEGVRDVRFLAWTENLLLRSLTHSSLVKILPQTDFTIALAILGENSLSTVFSCAPFARGELWESGRSKSSGWSSLSDPTDHVEAVLLMSLPSCNKNNK